MTPTSPTASPGAADTGSAERAWTPVSIYTLAVVTIIYALNFLDRTILSVVLPLIKQDLHLSDTMLGLITGFAFVLLYSGLAVPIARLADRSNRRNILAVGCAVWSAMTVATGLVQNVAQLALSRFLMGAGEAAGIAPSTALLSDRFAARVRPLAMSIMTAGSGVAALVMLPIAGLIAQHHGWRMTYFVAGGIGLAMAALLYLTVPEPARRGGPVTQRTPFAEVWAQLRQLRSFRWICLAGALLAINAYAVLTWTPTFLMRVHDLGPAEAGASFGPIKGFANIVGVIFGGAITAWAARRDTKWLLLVPAIGAAIAMPAEIVFLLSDDLPIAFTGLAIASFAGVIHFGPTYAALAAIVPPSMRATTTAIFLFCVNMVGQIIGPLAIGYLNDRWAGSLGEDAIRYSMILGGICAFLAALILTYAARHLRHDIARYEDATA
ncbi:spinster family MFS transporter [Sphingomonas floccifaciens]|uniref:Spinster family MFS transporter n=1 Tax=Sphingomonas floccifaciens TaxID=1844115 RepID=A0ABW4NFG3_9SPHN